MKALIYKQYGGPEQLFVAELPKPTPKPDEILVRVHACSLNSWDWGLLEGRPLVNRMGGFRGPNHPVLGSDVAGVVEAVGEQVTQWKPGDRVLADLSADRWGGLAEYVTGKAKLWAPLPEGLAFEEAAALPQAGILALQGLENGRAVAPGHRVLINGAAGGVGSFAIPMAKALGAHVTGVDHTDKLDLMRSWGADEVLDYTKVEYTDQQVQYDVVLDNVMQLPKRAYRKILTKEGRAEMVGGKMKYVMPTVLGTVINKKAKVRVVFHKPNAADLTRLIEQWQAGIWTPQLDGVYALADGPKAFARIGSGEVRGKAVITLDA